MFFLRKPDEAAVLEYIDRQRSTNLTYADVGSTNNDGTVPDGVGAGKAGNGSNVDHNRVLLGHGRDAYERAKDALCAWKMFNVGWVDPFGADGTLHCLVLPSLQRPLTSPLSAGTPIAIRIHHMGFWSLNAARIVYAFDDAIHDADGAVVKEQFGFAYGTLADHSECGEERFAVEWLRADDTVWYDLYAFSKPRNFLARIGKPLARMLQKRFARDSMQAMARAMRTVESVA